MAESPNVQAGLDAGRTPEVLERREKILGTPAGAAEFGQRVEDRVRQRLRDVAPEVLAAEAGAGTPPAQAQLPLSRFSAFNARELNAARSIAIELEVRGAVSEGLTEEIDRELFARRQRGETIPAAPVSTRDLEEARAQMEKARIILRVPLRERDELER